MDVKAYYRRLRQMAAELEEGDHVVVSEATADGGIAGVISEVTREIACKLLVEGRARLASVEEVEIYRKSQQIARKHWEKSQAAQRIHVQLMNGLEQEAQKRKTRRS